MTDRFEHGKFDRLEKRVPLRGPGLDAWIDFDDVNREEVTAAGRAMVRVLNECFTRYMEVYREELLSEHKKRWDSDPELREEYPDFESYFSEFNDC